MPSWRDFARKQEPGGRANSAKSANSLPEEAPEAPNGTNGTNGTGALSPDVLAGVYRLKGMGVPARACPKAWAETVTDALGLVSDGWAEQALTLGWSPLDLFGGVLDKGGDPYADGLAVWLSGRKLVLLTADMAMTKDASGNRHFFNLPRAPGARLLWALGHGR